MGIMCVPHIEKVSDICQGNTLVVEPKDENFWIGYRRVCPAKDIYEWMVIEEVKKTDDICLGAIIGLGRDGGSKGPFLGEYLEGHKAVKPKIYNARETTSDDSNGIRIIIKGTDYEKFVTFEKGSIA